MRTPGQYLALVRQMGPRWLFYRAGHAVRRRSGLLRRANPVAAWEQLPAPELNLRIRARAPTIPSLWGIACVDEAESILRGDFGLFSHQVVAAGFPPDWHRNQLGAVGGRPLDATRHWSDLSDAGGEDIKGVWELSRFAWAFALVRAHARTGDPRFAAAFWRLFVDWCDHNQPNAGPNWMCGQEATFRLMAVVFAAESVGVPEAHRPQLSRFVVASAGRIAAHLDYALSQDNNHGVSECAGLITAALLLPDYSHAAGWLLQGLSSLEDQLDRLVYCDGGFSQHSLIYHRVLLHDLCWIRWRFDLSGKTSPTWLNMAANRALSFLKVITDPESGLAPLYGANDGANVLPLADAEFLDMRPVIQMSAALFQGSLPLPPGTWDEAAAWLKADWEELPRSSCTLPTEWHAPISGCYQLCRDRGRLFLRCPTRFRHRPAQVDMLHVDVWHKGQPVVMDGGSFSYNSRERFSALGDAAHHNVLTVDNTEPVRKFSRFLYLPWPTGNAGPMGFQEFSCSHNGYTALGMTWTRKVSAGPHDGFLVRDIVRCNSENVLRWHWRLVDTTWKESGKNCLEGNISNCSYRISWFGTRPVSYRLIRQDSSSAHGWWAPYYGSVEPAVSLLLEVVASGDFRLSTEFQPLP